MLFGTAKGKMGPGLWGIIKCSVKGVDLTSARVLHMLHQESGFTAAESWELRVWERILTLKKAKNQSQPKSITVSLWFSEGVRNLR